MSLDLDTQIMPLDKEDVYLSKFGTAIPRTGKIFSYTFWRTQVNKDVFWSVQGNDMEGIEGAWIATQYLGPAEQGRRFAQEITLRHPTERRVQMTYRSSLEAGRNCVVVSRHLLHHFRKPDNSFDFEFRIVRLRRRPFPQRKY